MLKGWIQLELKLFESEILRELWRRSLSLWVIVDGVITIEVISELREEVNQLKEKNNQLEESLKQVNQSIDKLESKCRSVKALAGHFNAICGKKTMSIK